MAKIPGIEYRPLGRYHAQNLPKLDYSGQTRAMEGLIDAIGSAVVQAADSDYNDATAKAAKELSQLRVKLEASNTIPLNELPDEVLAEIEMPIFNEKGERMEVTSPFVFTHKVADEWWGTKSEEIVQTYASQIKDKEARNKFINDITERYIAPGTMAIGKASIVKGRAYNQAQAETAIQEVLASNAPTAEREEAAREILARQAALGQDPTWIKNTLAGLGPRVDQVDVQNRLNGATSKEEVELILEEMWEGGTRMTPEQMRTVNSQGDRLATDFDAKNRERQTENADVLFGKLYADDLTVEEVRMAVINDNITNEKAQVLFNALNEGGTTKATNSFTLSHWRGEIIKLPYTGNQATVTNKGEFLKNSIQMAAMGLNPNGTPMDGGATITGTDAATLVKEIDEKVSKTLFKSEPYKTAWTMIKGTTGVTGGIEGSIRGELYGSEPAVKAAVAFKQALDTYMDEFGIDADPVSFFNANKDTFSPDNYVDATNKEFLEFYPGAGQYMRITTQNGNVTGHAFPQEGRRQFVADMREAAASGSIPIERVNEIMARYAAYYLGRGVPPPDQALMFEEDHPLYRQFK